MERCKKQSAREKENASAVYRNHRYANKDDLTGLEETGLVPKSLLKVVPSVLQQVVVLVDLCAILFVSIDKIIDPSSR